MLQAKRGITVAGEVTPNGGNGHDVGGLDCLTAALGQAAVIEQRRVDESGRADTLPTVRLQAASSVKRMVDPAGELQELYDPDSIGKGFYHPAEEIIRHAYVPVRTKEGWCDPPYPHRIQTIVGFDQKTAKPILKEHRIGSAEKLHQLSESREYKRSRMMESTGDWYWSAGLDRYDRVVRNPLREAWNDTAKPAGGSKLKESSGDSFGFGADNASGAGGPMAAIDADLFVPITGGPWGKQLYLYAHWEAVAKCFEMKNHSELAKATCDIVADFALGRGVTWKIKNEVCRDTWEEFWKRNNMSARFRQFCSDSVWQGELMIRKDEPLKGFMRVREVDPSAVYEIVCDPQDLEQVYFYQIQYPAPYVLPFNILNGQRIDVPATKYVIEQVPPNEMWHGKLNVTAYEKWGRSDYFASLGTLKRLRDWINAATLKDMLQANLVWKLKIHGDETDVQAFMNDPQNAQLPPPAGTWIENDALELTAMHEDVSGSRGMGQGSTGNFLIALYAASQHFPSSYFNLAAGGMARATALVASEPVAKKIATRQQFLRGILDHLYEEVIKRAIDARRISADVLRQGDSDPEWVFPTTYEEDRGAKFRDLGLAFDRRAISHRTMATSMGQELSLDAHDYDGEMEQIAEDEKNPTLLAPLLPISTLKPGGQGGNLGGNENLTGADATANFKANQNESPGAGAPPVRESGRARALSESDRARVRDAARRGCAVSDILDDGGDS